MDTVLEFFKLITEITSLFVSEKSSFGRYCFHVLWRAVVVFLAVGFLAILTVIVIWFLE